MYKKLLPLVNQFIYLRQGYFSRYYEGKLLEVTPETLTLQAYDDQGNEEASWVIALNTVTEFMTGDRDLDELNMRVSLAKTNQLLESMNLEQTQPHFELSEVGVASRCNSTTTPEPKDSDPEGPALAF
jgi:hypothetical protein